MTVEAERKLILTFEVNTFGTEAQAERTAERIKRMLEVELHAPIRLVRASTKVRKPRKRKAAP